MHASADHALRLTPNDLTTNAGGVGMANNCDLLRMLVRSLVSAFVGALVIIAVV